MIQIPFELLKPIMEWVKENELSMFEMGDNSVSFVVVAQRELSPDQAAIIICHQLLTGVMSGQLNRAQRDGVETQELMKKPLN